MSFKIDWENENILFYFNVSFSDITKAAKEIESRTGKQIEVVRGEEMPKEDMIGKYVEVSISGEETITGTIIEFTSDGVMMQDKNDDNDSRRITDFYYIPMINIYTIHHNVDGEY